MTQALLPQKLACLSNTASETFCCLPCHHHGAPAATPAPSAVGGSVLSSPLLRYSYASLCIVACTPWSHEKKMLNRVFAVGAV